MSYESDIEQIPQVVENGLRGHHFNILLEAEIVAQIRFGSSFEDIEKDRGLDILTGINTRLWNNAAKSDREYFKDLSGIDLSQPFDPSIVQEIGRSQIAAEVNRLNNFLLNKEEKMAFGNLKDL